MDESLKDVRCVRCGGAAMQGTLRDSRGAFGNVVEPQTWMPRMTGGGSLLGQSVAKDAAKAHELPVVALRCTDCGHIDLFAPREAKAH